MGRTETEYSLDNELDRIAHAVRASGIGIVTEHQYRRSRNLALALLDPNDERRTANLAVLTFAAELLNAIAVDLTANPSEAQHLLEALEETGLTRAAIGREVLRGPHASQLGPEVALEVELGLLRIFTRASAASLWARSSNGEPAELFRSGSEDRDRSAERRLVRELADRDDHECLKHANAAAIAIKDSPAAAEALILRGISGARDEAALLLESALPGIELLLERTEMHSGHQAAQAGVISALERRIARLRFDLHDGPQQDLHLLAADLRLFREQLRPIVTGHRHAQRVLGRLDDLEAQLVALDGDLRHIGISMQSPFLPAGTLPEAISDTTAAFARRTGIKPDVQLVGDFNSLTDSQQITLLALVREALSNVRKHSGARSVRVAIAAREGGVEVEVFDDGRGFDPEDTLVQAARDGHLGVVGIHERVRMLGGTARIDSRPGGPTVISAMLPPWSGEAEEPETD